MFQETRLYVTPFLTKASQPIYIAHSMFFPVALPLFTFFNFSSAELTQENTFGHLKVVFGLYIKGILLKNLFWPDLKSLGAECTKKSFIKLFI